MPKTKPKSLSSPTQAKPTVSPGPFAAIVRPRTPNQKILMDTINSNNIIAAVGPAGTGKTKISVAMAVERLKDPTNKVKKLILMRPAVEAQEKIGFLPGDTRAKLHPYLVPLFDFLTDHYSNEELEDLMKGLMPTIEIAPLGMCRGRNFENCVVVCDEMQNATLDQIILITTRLCENCTIILNGDPSQIDLRPKGSSGLKSFVEDYGNIDGIGVVTLDRSDIVRHPLVGRIVERKIKLEAERYGD